MQLLLTPKPIGLASFMFFFVCLFFGQANSALVTLKVRPQESSRFTRCPILLSSESHSAAVHRLLKTSAGMRGKKIRLDYETKVENNDKDKTSRR